MDLFPCSSVRYPRQGMCACSAELILTDCPYYDKCFTPNIYIIGSGFKCTCTCTAMLFTYASQCTEQKTLVFENLKTVEVA